MTHHCQAQDVVVSRQIYLPGFIPILIAGLSFRPLFSYHFSAWPNTAQSHSSKQKDSAPVSTAKLSVVGLLSTKILLIGSDLKASSRTKVKDLFGEALV
jgi:hypothetical protein